MLKTVKLEDMTELDYVEIIGLSAYVEIRERTPSKENPVTVRASGTVLNLQYSESNQTGLVTFAEAHEPTEARWDNDQFEAILSWRTVH